MGVLITNSNVYVTKPTLPELGEYVKHLQVVWDSAQVTNGGQYLKRFEAILSEYLGVKHAVLVSNGTLAIQLAIKALGVQGKVLSTPFSFVATTSAVHWLGLDVKFADIDARSLCMSPAKIRGQMDSEVSAILATHIFGNPCDVEAIAEIGREWGVPVIYDAAHTFGVSLNQQGIMNFGDLSILSLHATKLFHSVEGGVVTTNDDELAARLRRMRNFGYDDSGEIMDVGINAKMSELHAAFGVSLFPTIHVEMEARLRLFNLYNKNLKNCHRVRRPEWHSQASQNGAYYPLIVDSEALLLELLGELKLMGVHARRYFYPALSRLDYVKGEDCPLAQDLATRVLCLPLFGKLEQHIVAEICDVVQRVSNGKVLHE